MKLTLLIFVASLLQVAFVAVAVGQPPDSIPNSPVPPIKPPQARTAYRVAALDRAPYPGTPSGAVAPNGKYEAESAEDFEAERVKIWNSPEMVQARAWVLDYSTRSARTSPQDAQQFLAQLRQVSPTEMEGWLERFQAERARIARQQAVEKAARQMMVEDALGRLQATREAYANINLGKTQAALTARERHFEQQLFSQQMADAIRLGRDYTVALSQEPRYDPMAPTLDPASPNRFVRSFAAATLPGDLPPGDSRNFIRGEEGIDTGEGEPIAEGVGGGASP